MRVGVARKGPRSLARRLVRPGRTAPPSSRALRLLDGNRRGAGEGDAAAARRDAFALVGRYAGGAGRGGSRRASRRRRRDGHHRRARTIAGRIRDLSRRACRRPLRRPRGNPGGAARLLRRDRRRRATLERREPWRARSWRAREPRGAPRAGGRRDGAGADAHPAPTAAGRRAVRAARIAGPAWRLARRRARGRRLRTAAFGAGRIARARAQPLRGGPRARRGLDDATRTALLPVATVPLYLELMSRRDYNPFRWVAEPQPWRRQWRLWRAARAGL